jgi:threonine aldolase
MIELRSDTFTLPTPAMLEAIQTAALGDDVWGEDPTVNALEQKAAALLGKEAALFVASGTMGNLLAILAHTQRGDEVIVGDQSHIVNYEVAGSAVVGGVQLRTVPNTPRGTLDPTALRAAIRSKDIHQPPTALICVENTHNRCGGAVLDVDDLRQVREVAVGAGIPVHMDGARIFNAAVALGVPACVLAAEVDSVTFCLSKGLSAPVGSVLCGSSDFIERARRWRKMVGGGMRQAGVLAAPGIVALDTMIDRLAEDHVHARLLGEALAAVPGVSVDLVNLRTNIVIADVSRTGRSATEVAEIFFQHGVKVSTMGPTTVRLVTHRGVTREDVEYVVRIIKEILSPTTALSLT